MKEKKQNLFNPTFWNQKYINNDIGWDIGSPTPIFVNWSKSLKERKKILIPGSGRGHDALFLSKQNHDIFANDFSKEAIKYLNIKAKELNLPIKTICQNFFSLSSYYGKMDIVLEYTFFCAINPKLRLKYIEEVSNLLKRNGLFVGILLPINKDIKEGGPPYAVNYKRTLKDFSKYFELLECKKSELSIKPRKNNEIFVIMKKK